VAFLIALAEGAQVGGGIFSQGTRDVSFWGWISSKGLRLVATHRLGLEGWGGRNDGGGGGGVWGRSAGVLHGFSPLFSVGGIVPDLWLTMQGESFGDWDFLLGGLVWSLVIGTTTENFKHQGTKSTEDHSAA